MAYHSIQIDEITIDSSLLQSFIVPKCMKAYSEALVNSSHWVQTTNN